LTVAGTTTVGGVVGRGLASTATEDRCGERGGNQKSERGERKLVHDGPRGWMMTHRDG
jgi:hypothetical protein